MRVLLTGAAGFIGFHTALRLCRDGHEVLGLDCLNGYYDPRLKRDRLGELGIPVEEIQPGRRVASRCWPGLGFVQQGVEEGEALLRLLEEEGITHVCHLAAQAGVRYSLEQPQAYLKSNLDGFLQVLEACRHHPVAHLVYASSSSVYGLNTRYPFRETDMVDHPVSLYAASKKANELMAHTYSHLFGIPSTGLRFFTVYGPWGRPDMAYWTFTRDILAGRTLKVYNNGEMARSFTYVDDVVEGLVRLLERPPSGNPGWTGEAPDPATSPAPYRVYNIGSPDSVRLMDFIQTLEQALGVEAPKTFLPLQPGDVVQTAADTAALQQATGYTPRIPLKEGVERFVTWYRGYFRV